MKKVMYHACLIGGLLGHSGLSHAVDRFDYVDIRASGININDGKVYIKPVNGNYGQATASTSSYHVEMKAACKGNNILKTSFVAFGTENASGKVIEASGNYRQSFSTLEKTLPWKEITLNMPLTKLGFNPAAMCQAHLDSKLAQGVSRQQVLASDFIINKPVTLSAVAGCGQMGRDNEQYGTAKLNTQLKITCKGGSVAGINDIQVAKPKPPQNPGGFQAKMQVTAIDFKATPYQLSTTCPARAKFTGNITTSGPGSVSYRVLFPGSAKSSVRTLKFDKAGTRNIGIAEYDVTSSIPSGSATLEIISPVSKKAHASFKVNCIAAKGAGGINLSSQPNTNATPQFNKLNAVPALPAKPVRPKPAADPLSAAKDVKRSESDGSNGTGLLLPAIQK